MSKPKIWLVEIPAAICDACRAPYGLEAWQRLVEKREATLEDRRHRQCTRCGHWIDATGDDPAPWYVPLSQHPQLTDGAAPLLPPFEAELQTDGTWRRVDPKPRPWWRRLLGL